MKLNKPFCLWFTGLPCSGKTTLAEKIQKNFKENNVSIELFDGDEIRKELSRDLGFSKQDRKLNNERIIYVAKVLVRNGVPTLVAFVSPFNEIRTLARGRIKNYILVYVDTSLEECKKRDVKGMYKKALAGEIKDFTGIDSPFEEPEDYEIRVNTDKESVDESVEKIMKYLMDHEYVVE